MARLSIYMFNKRILKYKKQINRDSIYGKLIFFFFSDSEKINYDTENFYFGSDCILKIDILVRRKLINVLQNYTKMFPKIKTIVTSEFIKKVFSELS